MQRGCVQAHQSVQTKGDSGKQDQESKLYNYSLLLSVINCDGEAAYLLPPRQSVSQQKKKKKRTWEAESRSFSVRFRALYSKKFNLNEKAAIQSFIPAIHFW